MENVNKTYKNILKKGMKLSSFLNWDTSKNKNNAKIKFNPKLTKRTNIYLNKRDHITSKNDILTNVLEKPKNKNISLLENIQKDFSFKYPSSIKKSAIVTMLKKNNSARNIIKKDASVQNNFINSTMRLIPNIRCNNILLNLIEKIPKKKDLKDINYIIESPYRGLEKIQLSKSVSNVKKRFSLYKSIYNNNNNHRGYIYLKQRSESFGNFPDINKSNSSMKRDKYIDIKKNKEIDNPLEKISKMSGVSCYKLRQVINYSLRHNINDLTKNENNENIMSKKFNKLNKHVLKNDRYKKIYSMINLKSRQEHKCNNISEKSIDLDDEVNLENVIYAKKKNDYKKSLN